MDKLVRIALAALFLLGIASAQNIPQIEVFGGYSYLNFDLPANPSTGTTSQRLTMNGWDISAAVRVFRHISIEGDFSGHSLSDCTGITTLKCSDFSYMGGPRWEHAMHSGKITAFVHGLIGQDSATLPGPSGVSVSDSSVAVAAGAGLDYWIYHNKLGVQLGPFDYFYTRHLNEDAVPAKTTFASLPESFTDLAAKPLRVNPRPEPRVRLLRPRIRARMFLLQVNPRLWPHLSRPRQHWWEYRDTGCRSLRSDSRSVRRNSTEPRFWRSCREA